MTVDRRGFLRAAAVTAVTGVSPQGNEIEDVLAGQGIEGLGMFEPVIPEDPRLAQLRELAERRQQIINGDVNGNNMGFLSKRYDAELTAIKRRHLGHVKGDASLLNQQEAVAYHGDLVKLQKGYRGRMDAFDCKIGTVDEQIAAQGADIRRMYASGIDRDREVARLSLGRKGGADEAIKSMDAPFDSLPGDMVADIVDIAHGRPPRELARMRANARATGDAINEQIATAEEMQHDERPEGWEEKRRAALLESIDTSLTALAAHAHVRIESSLTKGYGPDDWTIASSGFQHSEMYKDPVLAQHMADLDKACKAYCEGTTTEIAHTTPGQSGYGEHDCERVRIMGPDWSLRETLRRAGTLNLQSRYGETLAR